MKMLNCMEFLKSLLTCGIFAPLSLATPGILVPQKFDWLIDWLYYWLIDLYAFEFHHHCVPSVVNRSAVMDLHRSRSCATLMQSLYDISVHSLMLSVHIVLGLPRPLLPFILPSISNRGTPSPLIIYPNYWHFLEFEFEFEFTKNNIS